MNKRFLLNTQDLTPQGMNAFRISLIGMVASTLTATVYLIHALYYGDWQLYVWSADIWVLFLATVASLLLIRRGRVTTAVWVLLITVQLTFLGAVGLIDGSGLIIGISITALIAVIAGQTLPSGHANWAIVSGVASGIAAILLELFLPYQRLPQPPFIRFYLPGILLTVIVLFGFVTIQQFRNYQIRTKLIIVFTVVVIGSVGLIAALSSITLRANIAEDVGNQLNVLASSKAVEIGLVLEQEYNLLQTLAYNGTAQELAAASSKETAFEPAEIERLDAHWRAADRAGNDNDPLVKGVISTSLGDELREFQSVFPQHVEIFLTNRQGINIAATNRTSDYYQADEEWWQAAMQDGQYIGQPEFDESSNTLSLIMAVRLQDPETQIITGILRTTVNLASLTDSLATGLFGNTGHTDIYLPDGRKIELNTNEDGTFEIELAESELDIDALTASDARYVEIFHKDVLTLASQSAVAGTGSPGGGDLAISNLEWKVAVLQDQSEAFQSVENQTRNIILLAIAIVIGAAFLAIGLAQILSTPITRLNSAAQEIASGNLSIQAEAETEDEIGSLALTFNKMTSQLRELFNTLEQRVAERTSDLEESRRVSERRAQELQSISEISRAISIEQRLEILLPLITRLVSELFDFYHVGIFFVDAEHRLAHLQAANSEGGQRMLAREHRLELGKGLVGTVAQTGKPRIALDVGSDAVFFDNPDLPGTRSEMALPLNLRGQTIGVLDVQSTQPGAFTENDANTLGILADQVAIAIENARLFASTQQALNDAQTLYNQYLQKEWTALQGRKQNVGYWKTVSGSRYIETPVETDEIRHALRTGQTVVVGTSNPGTDPAVIAPIKLRGQTIGVLNIKATGDRQWNRDELDLIQSVTDRLALALENARLFEETTQRAERERLVSEITGKIRSRYDPQTMIETAVQELRSVLGASRVDIIPRTSSGKDSKV